MPSTWHIRYIYIPSTWHIHVYVGVFIPRNKASIARRHSVSHAILHVRTFIARLWKPGLKTPPGNRPHKDAGIEKTLHVQFHFNARCQLDGAAEAGQYGIKNSRLPRQMRPRLSGDLYDVTEGPSKGQEETFQQQYNPITCLSLFILVLLLGFRRRLSTKHDWGRCFLTGRTLFTVAAI